MTDSANKLRLQWRDHGSELAALSRDVFCQEDLTDVTLACRGGAPFPAHKLVLAAASNFFRYTEIFAYSETGFAVTQYKAIWLQ